MADDYIRRQAAIDIVVFECGKWTGLAKEISKQLKQLPAADVVSVVRCRDCKHHAYDEIFSCYWCEYPGRVRDTTPDGFCEKGEE